MNHFSLISTGTELSNIKTVHGIIGQTFQKNRRFAKGNVDDYSGKNYVQTTAQAEGVIDGVFTDYIMEDETSSKFKYSMFNEFSVFEDYKIDKVSEFNSVWIYLGEALSLPP